MCCQITPAIGHRAHEAHDDDALAFHTEEENAERSNAQRRTPNVECRKSSSEFGIRRWALDVGRLRLSLKCLHRNGRIPSNDGVWRNAFRYNRSRSHHGIFADGHAFQNRRVHSDPDIVGDDDRRGF